jgi:hypothetical protein
MDPLTGRTGIGRLKDGKIRLVLQPGHSIILRTFTERAISGEAWKYVTPGGDAARINGPWLVEFTSGGPVLPPSFKTEKPASWTARGGEAERFAGTALYTTTFDAPEGNGPWGLDLGEVCHSARVSLNGEHLGTLIMPPYCLRADGLRPKSNRLEIEVTNLSANRIRDLDRRKVEWRIFHDINFVDIRYQPFDASEWPVRDSGLLGPVRLIRMNVE